MLPRSKQDRAAECVGIGDITGEALASRRARLATDGEVGTGFHAKSAVAGAVGKKRGGDREGVLGGLAHGLDGGDAAGAGGEVSSQPTQSVSSNSVMLGSRTTFS